MIFVVGILRRGNEIDPKRLHASLWRLPLWLVS
jgi:hypothetical protein